MYIKSSIRSIVSRAVRPLVVLVALELINVGDRSDYITLFFILIPNRVVVAYDFIDDRLLIKLAS